MLAPVSLAAALVVALAPLASDANARPEPGHALRADIAEHLEAAGFDVPAAGWTVRAPVGCRVGTPGRACRSLGKAWNLPVATKLEKKTWDLDVWTATFGSPTKAREGVELLDRDQDFGPFGKAPVFTWTCGRTVVATVGVFRGPTPHRMLRDAMGPALQAAGCVNR